MEILEARKDGVQYIGVGEVCFFFFLIEETYIKDENREGSVKTAGRPDGACPDNLILGLSQPLFFFLSMWI